MDNPLSSPRPRRFALIGAVVGLLGLFAALCVGWGWNTSPAFDEPFLIGAGYSFLKGDKHAQLTGNLVLSEEWNALPLLAMKTEPPTEEDYRTAAMQLRNAYWLSLFKSEHQMRIMLRATRVMNTLLGMALAVAVFFWSRRLHGDIAGLISLAFYCLCPVVIANSGLATTDIATALFFLLAVGSFWALLHRISVWTILGCGLAVGGLMATKLSGVLIVPMAVLMMVAKLSLRHQTAVALPGRGARQETNVRRQVYLLAGASLAAALAAYLTLWAIYGFRYPFGIQTLDGSSIWYIFNGQSEGVFSNYIVWCRKLRLLPEHFLLDVSRFMFEGQHRLAFLMGKYSAGWWYFFPVAWFFKTPIPFLIAVLAGVMVMIAARWRRPAKEPNDTAESAVNFYEFIPLAMLFIVYLGALMVGELNIGIRHLLPVYPVLFIFVGVLARHRRAGIALAVALLAWSAGEVWAVYPQMLAYFNEFAGGPKNGYRILVDSSYEWGQDLPAVEKWLAQRASRPGPKPPVYFSYFGSGLFRTFKLNSVTLLPSYIDQPRSFDLVLQPGTYIISATRLQSMYNHTASGPWSKSDENIYQHLVPSINKLRQRFDLLALDQLKMAGAIQRYDDLRLARLCAYLRKREPDERITYGILVYELSQKQLEEALSGPPAGL